MNKAGNPARPTRQKREGKPAAAVDTQARDKLRGGYYTPVPIARWMCGWAVRAATDTILEPSAGNGNFVTAAAEALRERGAAIDEIAGRIRAVEIDTTEAQKVTDRLTILLEQTAPRSVVCADFFQWHDENNLQRFNVVVGNPPFIRYQNFPEPSRTRAMEMMARLGMRANKLTNIWVPFAAAATESLEVNGRLALVLPAELLQVSYAAQLRSFLVDHFRTIDVLTCNQILFENAEQEVVILLADGRVEHPSARNKCAIDMRETKTVEDLLLSPVRPNRPRAKGKMIRHDSEKWLKYFLTPPEIAFMRRLREAKNVAPLTEHATIDVGVVTGENSFFVLSQAEVEQRGLAEYCLPLVGRSVQLRGAIVNAKEWASLAAEGHRAYLFTVDRSVNGSLTPEAKRYVEQGERAGTHKGYKCSIRTPWYSVPAVWTPDCFFFRQIYDFPRVVLNQAGATSTDTIHRMTIEKGDAATVAAHLYTHLTAASSEIEGRSYGGGVLELEPTEAERLLVPKVLKGAMPLAEADDLIRAGRLADVLAENDKLVLQNGLGLTDRECTMLRRIWDRMRNRRMSRRRSGPHREP